MRASLLAALLVCFAVLPFASRAASISVTGADGVNGADGADALGIAPSGGAGSSGESVAPISDGPDASNSATAIGGVGGNGGKGGDSLGYDPISVGGDGGNGGAGGDALATAAAVGASGPVAAQATSQGGAAGYGGPGGSGLDFNGSFGGTGRGGDAESHASATGGSGSASASAIATGGSGGSPATGGGALADANAVSESGAADALARAFGAFGGVPGSAAAHAEAMTSGSESATATAEAKGAQPPEGTAVAPSSGDASAHAVSLLGDATATAHQTGGAAANSLESDPGRVDSVPISGGVGGDSVMVDKVSGAAGGRLTLSQEAIGGPGSPNGHGGNATSSLDATNPLGGELVAKVSAQGGEGAGSTYPADVGSYGGSATATVTALDTAGKYVEADASARGGVGGFVYFPGYLGGGNATAHATAQGLGAVLARADAATTFATPAAASDALASGAIVGAHVGLALSGGSGSSPYVPYTQTLQTQASVGAGTGASGAVLPATGVKQALLAAAPTATDLATWTAGNPNAQAALDSSNAAALGSFASDALNDGSHLTGTLELDLTAATYGPRSRLALAFLDPSATGSSLDLLHLTFSVDGAAAFDASFTDSATALAGLDDLVVDLGTLGTSSKSIRDLVLSFEVVFPEASTEGAFALDFALLAQAVPEPVSAALLLCAGATLLAVRRAARP